MESRQSSSVAVDDGWYKDGTLVWSELSKHKDAWLFAEPVKEEEAPGYFELIDQPMDLSTIKEHLDEQLYISKEDFARDVYLMLANCKTYNPPDSVFYQWAVTLEVGPSRVTTHVNECCQQLCIGHRTVCSPLLSRSYCVLRAPLLAGVL